MNLLIQPNTASQVIAPRWVFMLGNMERETPTRKPSPCWRKAVHQQNRGGEGEAWEERRIKRSFAYPHNMAHVQMPGRCLATKLLSACLTTTRLIQVLDCFPDQIRASHLCPLDHHHYWTCALVHHEPRTIWHTQFY